MSGDSEHVSASEAHDVRLLTRVVLRNYRSIAACDLHLGPLSIFVGPNGSGKSNFLDALRFVSEALRYSLDHALRSRGGLHEVRRRSSGHPTHFAMRLEFRLPSGHTGYYAFRVGAQKHGDYSIQQEECFIDSRPAFYKIENGKLVKANFAPTPPVPKDRLYLVNVSGLDAFRPLYEALSNMGFYNLSPDRIREFQSPDLGELLNRDGSNLTSVLANLQKHAPDTKQHIEEYLAKVAPGVSGVDAQSIGPKETLEFRQEVRGAKHAWRFLATNMSDGTLRALGILVALFQRPINRHETYHLVAIEEPETALHPAAAGILTDSLRDASLHSQVLVTSHSPDLLDDPAISDDIVFAVIAEHGESKIGRLNPTGRYALRDHLYTAGELLRMDQLRPDPIEANIQLNRLRIFGSGESLAARRFDC
ncbi:AAA family ATPase [Candidatus Entotheonella palauensis]|uniref:AAA family ATPase n=1 Tax=Candidatus Entotheonella palauensis TaxID=93172 RepID=UPI00352FF76E